MSIETACGPVSSVSAFVVAYNRAHILGTCLRALRFANEIIVIDKSSTDNSRMVAACHATKIISVPWSPTVEETRTFALSQCAHEWILFLDDDECLSAEAVSFIRAQLVAPSADIYAFPFRNYIIGVHDETAYYWPEHHVRLFRRGTVTFGNKVHDGIQLHSDKVMQIQPDNGVCIHHLSHPDIAGWIERTNRYTSRANRTRVADTTGDLVAFAHARIDHWLVRSKDRRPDGYPVAVALLRAIYDITDRLKAWEEQRGQDGNELFAQICARLDASYRTQPDYSALGRWCRRWFSRPACRRPPE